MSECGSNGVLSNEASKPYLEAVHRALRHPVLFKRALASALSHDVLNVAQSAAYSGIVALFPALIVAAAVIPLLPDTGLIRIELSTFFSRVLPSDVLPVLAAYFNSRQYAQSTVRALVGGVFVSVLGAGGVIATLMEGQRRAFDLPPDCWSFWRRRLRAYLLVPLSLLPLAVSSLLVVFGHILILWLTSHVGGEIRRPVYLLALLIRWVLASTGSVGLIALLYKLGTPLRQSWWRVLPGAVLATGMWLLTTLAFGWYVTRFANYSRVYGSLGAGIALLFWLYIVALSVLCGAEYNAQRAKP